jgi:hypothetical protein
MNFITYIATMFRCAIHTITNPKGDHRFMTVHTRDGKNHYFCTCEFESLVRKLGQEDESF